jgi:hypothetical protein
VSAQTGRKRCVTAKGSVKLKTSTEEQEKRTRRKEKRAGQQKQNDSPRQSVENNSQAAYLKP